MREAHELACLLDLVGDGTGEIVQGKDARVGEGQGAAAGKAGPDVAAHRLWRVRSVRRAGEDYAARGLRPRGAPDAREDPTRQRDGRGVRGGRRRARGLAEHGLAGVGASEPHAVGPAHAREVGHPHGGKYPLGGWLAGQKDALGGFQGLSEGLRGRLDCRRLALARDGLRRA